MKDNKGLERLNVDVLGLEKQAITAFREKDGLYRQRINQTISITKRGFIMIVLVLSLGLCSSNTLFPPSICIFGYFESRMQTKPIPNVVDSHDNSWLKQEESSTYWFNSYNFPLIEISPHKHWPNLYDYPLLESSPQELKVEPFPKINLPLHWPWR